MGRSSRSRIVGLAGTTSTNLSSGIGNPIYAAGEERINQERLHLATCNLRRK